MPFDYNLMLCDGSADWTYANLVSSDYGSPTSTTRNDGGFAVLDIREGPVAGLAVVLICADDANASDDALTLIVEECASADFSSSQPHELTKFDIAAATKGIILGSEMPCTVVRRISPIRQYLRVDASCNSGDDFGTCYVLLTPYPFKGI